jgi:hypothetical protein
MGEWRKKFRPKLRTPHYPDNGERAYYQNQTSDKKIVADYANISIPDTENLEIFEFWGLLHDAVVWNCNKTEHGREYLENAWIYAQTKADRNALRVEIGKGVKWRGK